MDDTIFDHLARLFAQQQPRRMLARTFGGGVLAALLGRLGLERADAKKKGKKKKKCRGNTTKCGKKACCRADQSCIGGKCVDVDFPDCQIDADCRGVEICLNGECVVQQECENADDCADNELCIAGQCRCSFPNKPCGDACCPEDQVCLNGQCVVGQGTCPATDDVCATGIGGACNGNDNCFCGQRTEGGARCIGGFLDDSRDNCICVDDADCERDFGAGAICIKGGPGCQCKDTDSGRCARLCPTQVGN